MRDFPTLFDVRADGGGSARGGCSRPPPFPDALRSRAAPASRSSRPSLLAAISSIAGFPLLSRFRSLRGSLGSTTTTRSTGPGRDAARRAIRHPSSSSLSFGGVTWNANRRYRIVDVVVGGERDDGDGRESPLLSRSGPFHGVNGHGVDGPAATLLRKVLWSSSPSGAGVDGKRGRHRCRFVGVYVSQAWPGAMLAGRMSLSTA